MVQIKTIFKFLSTSESTKNLGPLVKRTKDVGSFGEKNAGTMANFSAREKTDDAGFELLAKSLKRGTASVVLSPKARNAIKRLCSGKLPAKTIKNNKMLEIRTKINELYSKVEDSRRLLAMPVLMGRLTTPLVSLKGVYLSLG